MALEGIYGLWCLTKGPDHSFALPGDVDLGRIAGNCFGCFFKPGCAGRVVFWQHQRWPRFSLGVLVGWFGVKFLGIYWKSKASFYAPGAFHEGANIVFAETKFAAFDELIDDAGQLGGPGENLGDTGAS